MVSTLTMPFDSWVSNCQKANKAGEKKGAMAVARDMYRADGYRSFVRGWVMRYVNLTLVKCDDVIRLLHASYHTVWMTTLGQYMFEFWRAQSAKSA